MTNPVENFLSSTLIIMQNMVVVCHTVLAYVGSQKIQEAEPPPVGMWGLAK